MFIYAIKPRQSLPHSTDRDLILAGQLTKCLFKVGDVVRFKKPRRKPICGTVVAIEDDVDKITWIHGGLCPTNIVVDIERGGRTQRVKTNYRKLAFN